ncbi:hypothetical protein [Nostoc sp.]
MKFINSFLELLTSIICAITVAIILVPLHLLFAPLARSTSRVDKKEQDDR